MGPIPPEAAILGWMLGGAVSIFLAIMWLMYLNKIVQNEENLMEQIRADRRMREEKARSKEAR